MGAVMPKTGTTDHYVKLRGEIDQFPTALRRRRPLPRSPYFPSRIERR